MNYVSTVRVMWHVPSVIADACHTVICVIAWSHIESTSINNCVSTQTVQPTDRFHISLGPFMYSDLREVSILLVTATKH